MKLENIIKLKLNNFEINYPKKMEIDPNPCWENYEPIGLKPDGSPNCVPIKEEQRTVKEGFPIPSPGESETQDEYVSRCISSIIDEYGQEQAAGICYGQWEQK